MRSHYCIWLLLLLAAPAAAQQEAPAARASGYTVFLRGTPIGREDVTIRDDGSGLVITAQARRGPPAVTASGTSEIRYSADGAPVSLLLESTNEGREYNIRTKFTENSAVSEGSQAGVPVSKTDTISPRTIILPNGFFGAYAAVARRISTLAAGAELRGYIAPAGEVAIRVAAVNAQRIQTGALTIDVKRYDLALVSSNDVMAVSLSVDSNGQLVSVSIPAQTIDVVRDDVSAATARMQMHSNPGDEAAMIPAAGFNLGATLTRPAGATATRLPAVILLPGSGVGDRDGVAGGVPTLGQLAGALADAGFLTVRFDKRGYGQSGGRIESATLGDFAEDAIAVMKWLAARRDINPKRIAIVGHNEGAWVALMAAARERRIAAVASLAAPSVTGSQLVMEQQRHALDQLKTPDAERSAKIDLQTKINTAVVTGRGWDAIPPETRRQADTPWFQSLLMFDPARILKDVRQPMLFVHGQLDQQVPVSHLNRISDLAQKQSRSKSVAVVSVRGVNHLLVPAITGEVSEYASLTDRNVSKEVTSAIAEWLTKTFAAIK